MATTLIDTRLPIIPQIEASWNEWIETEEASVYRNSLTASEFKRGETPWTTKQSVLERNTVYANKLIRLYIELGIKVEDRWPVWKFFEMNKVVVNWVKDHISRLKRIQKVLKKQQQLGLELTDTTDLFMSRKNVQLYGIEDELKFKVEEAKAKANLKKVLEFCVKTGTSKQEVIAELQRQIDAERAEEEQLEAGDNGGWSRKLVEHLIDRFGNQL